MKDAGTQSYLWTGLSGILAFLGEQQNLMLISLAVGIVTALVNMYAKCQEGKAKRREIEQNEELHKLKVKQEQLAIEKLKKELGYDESQ